MKKILIIVFLSLIFSKIYSREPNSISLQKNVTIDFDIKEDPKSYNLLGYIRYSNGKIEAFGNGTNILIDEPEYKIEENFFYLYFSRFDIINFFDENKTFFETSFPIRYKIKISMEDIIKSLDRPKHRIDVSIQNAELCQITCIGYTINDCNVMDKPEESGNEIYIFEKNKELILYGQVEKVEDFSGKRTFWYEIRLDYEKYGWVNSSDVRIYYVKE